MQKFNTLKMSLVLLLALLNVAFFYAFAISLKGVFIALAYYAAAVVLPGCCIAGLFYYFFPSGRDEVPSWHLTLPLTTIFGIANVLISYLMGQAFHTGAYNYLFAWAYLLVLLKPVRTAVRSMIRFSQRPESGNQFRWKAPIILFYILIINVLFFLLRPTPGIVPLDIFHDHLWNAGNTVSLTSHFPLQSMNIAERPSIAYHILIHVMGAHMALTTGLTPHMVGLQFIFVPLIPLLVVTMAAFLEQILERKDSYVFYGLAVLLLGGGFAIIHEVKVRAYLGSNTNLLGVLLLFSVLLLITQAGKLNRTGRFISFFAGLFLATAAKGSIGAALAAGAVLWTCFRIWRKQLTGEDVTDGLGALSGFALSCLLFFVFPLWGQAVYADGMRTSFPLIPLSYVTKNDLASPFIDVIYKYLPGRYQVPVHVLFTVLFLPVFIVLYFSYRLLVLSKFKESWKAEIHQKIIFIALGSLAIALTVNTAPQDSAYFMTSGLFILDALFLRQIQQENIFSLIRSSFNQRHVYTLIGSLLILLLPFVTLGGWVKPEHRYNFFVYGRVGHLLDRSVSKTTYRQSHQSITPEVYEALSYIRHNTDRNSVVVSPFLDESDGRHLAFYTSTFSERTAFIEGYEFAGLAKEGLVRYVGASGITRKKEIVDEIYKKYDVPAEIQNKKYVVLADAKTRAELEKKYSTNTLFANDKWNVMQVVSPR